MIETIEHGTKNYTPFLNRLTGVRGIDLSSGDFRERSFELNLAILNASAKLMWEERLARCPQDLLDIEKSLLAEIAISRGYVAYNKNYSKDALQISAKLKSADEKSGGVDMLQRAANRFSVFQNFPRQITDFDGNITSDVSHIDKIPGSEVAEPLLAEYGREIFPKVFTRIWRELLIHSPQLFREAGKYAKVRAGVNEFFRYMKDHGATVEILSANFRPLVEGILETIPHARGERIWAVEEDSILSTDKGTIVEHAAKSDPDTPLIYVGDSSSDIPALEASSYVALWLAPEDSSFAKVLKDRNLTHLTYKTWFDQIEILKQIRERQKV